MRLLFYIVDISLRSRIIRLNLFLSCLWSVLAGPTLVQTEYAVQTDDTRPISKNLQNEKQILDNLPQSLLECALRDWRSLAAAY